MKVIRFTEIDDKKIITGISDASADPEATKAKIAELENIPLDSVLSLENIEELFEKNKVYFRLGPEQIYKEDDEAAPLIEKLKGLDKNQKLLVDGEIIPDFIGTEYYLKVNGKWEKRKIECIGQAPEGPLQEELTPEQLEEIRMQEEESRICCMTSEQRADAVQRELDALADEAARFEKRAQIQGNVFDPAAWYQERAAAVREKYSVAA